MDSVSGEGGFWDIGPHDPINVEHAWREFVRLADGYVVEDLVPEPRNFQNADFFFPKIPTVVELKEIVTEFEKSASFQKGMVPLLKRAAEEQPGWLPFNADDDYPCPAWFSDEVIRLFRPPISRILKKANGQIKQTKLHFGASDSTGILVLVNDGFTALEPHFVRDLARSLLMTSYSSIDCFIYATVNRYVQVNDSDVPRLLWMPYYSERAPDDFHRFVDDLGRRWFAFLDTKIGGFTEPSWEVSRDSDCDVSLQFRAIVPPRDE